MQRRGMEHPPQGSMCQGEPHWVAVAAPVAAAAPAVGMTSDFLAKAGVGK